MKICQTLEYGNVDFRITSNQSLVRHTTKNRKYKIHKYIFASKNTSKFHLIPKKTINTNILILRELENGFAKWEKSPLQRDEEADQTKASTHKSDS